MSRYMLVLIAAVYLMSISGCSKKEAESQKKHGTTGVDAQQSDSSTSSGDQTVQEIDIRLAEAVVKMDLKNIRMLLRKGANPNTIGEKGWLILSQAANLPTTDSVKTLIKAGANVNAADDDGTTPLMHAAFADFRVKQSVAWRSLNVKVLLESGAEVNATNHRGRSALYYAAAGGALSMCELLIEAGANPNTKTIEGENPLDIAKKRGHEEIVKFLKECNVSD